MGFSIKYDSMCENCEFKDLHLDPIEYSDADGYQSTCYALYCSHEKVCNTWNKKLYETLRRNE